MSTITALTAQRDKYLAAAAKIDEAITLISEIEGEVAPASRSVSLKTKTTRKPKAAKPKAAGKKKGRKPRVSAAEVQDRVLNAIRENGPMTTRELEAATDTNYVAVKKALDALDEVQPIGDAKRNAKFGLVESSNGATAEADEVESDEDEIEDEAEDAEIEVVDPTLLEDEEEDEEVEQSATVSFD